MREEMAVLRRGKRKAVEELQTKERVVGKKGRKIGKLKALRGDTKQPESPVAILIGDNGTCGGKDPNIYGDRDIEYLEKQLREWLPKLNDNSEGPRVLPLVNQTKEAIKAMLLFFVQSPAFRNADFVFFACSIHGAESTYPNNIHGAESTYPNKSGQFSSIIVDNKGGITDRMLLQGSNDKAGIIDIIEYYSRPKALRCYLLGKCRESFKSLNIRLDTSTEEEAMDLVAAMDFDHFDGGVNNNDVPSSNIDNKKLLKRLEKLKKKYKKEFPRGTPLVCACQHGRLEDVKLLITGYNDVNGSNGNNNMTLKEYVNQEGKTSGGNEWTPLMTAARYEHFQVVKYLIEQCEADPNIARSNRSDGYNALHWAARNNRTTTELIQLLLTHMSLNSINKKDRWGYTPLDNAYRNNYSPLRQDIIALLRSKGGKANWFDANGRRVGKGTNKR
eukprot:g2141.t1